MMMFMGDNQYLGNFRVVLDELLKVCEDRNASIVLMMRILLLFHISSLMGLKGVPISISDTALMEKVQLLMQRLHPGGNDGTVKLLIDSATRVDNVRKMGVSWCSWL